MTEEQSCREIAMDISSILGECELQMIELVGSSGEDPTVQREPECAMDRLEQSLLTARRQANGIARALKALLTRLAGDERFRYHVDGH